MNKKILRQAFDERLEKKGIRMSKLINRGGMFIDDTYDKRIVHNRIQLEKLNDEGFILDEDSGVWIFNLIKNI